MSKYNRGINVTVKATGMSDIPIETLSYQPTWETESESFETWDYTTHTSYKGDRFSVSITTGILTKAEMQALRAALLTHEFTLVCPEFPSGELVRLTSLSFPTAADNYGTEYYQISFAVASVALLNGSGL